MAWDRPPAPVSHLFLPFGRANTTLALKNLAQHTITLPLMDNNCQNSLSVKLTLEDFSSATTQTLKLTILRVIV